MKSGAGATDVAAFRYQDGDFFLHVRLTPRGGRDALDGMMTGADGKAYLAARVSTVPEDGAANAALIALLAKALGVRKSDIELASGARARMKTLRITGDAEDIASRLAMISRT